MVEAFAGSREAVAGFGAWRDVTQPLTLRGGGDESGSAVRASTESSVEGENLSYAGFGNVTSDGQHPSVQPEYTQEEMMQKMVGALVTVNLKIGPQLRGRLASIDDQMNILLSRPVEQWVNETLASVDDADIFVRHSNVVDFGVLYGTEDPATHEILRSIGITPGEGWDDGKDA
jgi:small nuclear ribonucleoprotein (snRNP)-like protein